MRFRPEREVTDDAIVTDVMGSSCNVAFSFQHNSLLVVARQDLVSSTDAQELLVDYGMDYWVHYVV